uniref:LysR substrate-binding domain-containing protein n=1 Tax=Halomonas sp. TaxID=1486246 RepID=UPI002624282B|nr:LysR substrate-binding domain-containing protein [Halomonas sp.]
MAISYSQLRAFHGVAVYGSFTRAAQRLHLSQPAVSDQLRKLEEHYGVRLFHRTKREVRLTDIGQQLLAVTQRLFDAADEAEDLLVHSRELRTGSLTLAVDSPVHALPLMSAFQARYPDIQIRLITGNTDEALARLERHQADFAIVGREPAAADLLTMKLSSSPLVAFVALQHPWGQRDSVTLEELGNVSLVLRERGSMTRQLIEQELHRAGVTPQVAFEAEGREAVMELVGAGLGVGVVSGAEAPRHEGIRILSIDDAEVQMVETLVCMKSQSERRLIAALLHEVEQLET